MHKRTRRRGPAPVVDLSSVRALRRHELAERRVRAALGPRTTLIGFAGAPWTVATYMVEGGASRDFRHVKGWAYRDPQGFGELIGLLTEATTEFLTAEIAAGAEVVQLFDSWAGVLPEAEFARWVIEPTARIVAELKKRHAHCPVIGFPRGAGVLYERYVSDTRVDAVSLDTTLPLDFACTRLGSHVALQGNLDPVLLLAGGDILAAAISDLRRAFAGMRWVFNLGHGVLPQTPPENVAALARLINGPDST